MTDEPEIIMGLPDFSSPDSPATFPKIDMDVTTNALDLVEPTTELTEIEDMITLTGKIPTTVKTLPASANQTAHATDSTSATLVFESLSTLGTTTIEVSLMQPPHCEYFMQYLSHLIPLVFYQRYI